MSRATPPLILVFISCLLVLALFPRIHAFEQGLQARQIPGGSSGVGATTESPTPTSTPTSTATPTSTPPSTTPSPTSAPASSTTAVTSATTPTPTTSSPGTTAAPTTSTPTPTTTTVPNESHTPTPTTLTSTDTGSHEVTTIVTDTPTNTLTTSPAATTSPSSGNSTGGSSSLGTGSIIGLSVAGGVAVIGIIAFLVWKFTRKRFSDFDDNEAIKWPELNTHGGGDSHPLPVHNTGRAGFGDTESLRDMSRAPSVTGYADSMTTSTTELYPGVGADPYAVPPLPHLNPNQPYQDDPQAQAFYDPYRGPIPNTFDAGEADTSQASGWTGEAIPMTQMSPGGRSRSPGPQMAYDEPGQAMSPQRMASRRSPAPAAALAYGEPPLPSFSGGPVMEGRARSPGPAVGFGGPPVAGRQSPGPQGALDPYGAR